jgi:hypothetical protein
MHPRLVHHDLLARLKVTCNCCFCSGHSVLVVCSQSAVQFTKDAAASYSSAAAADGMQYYGIAYQYNYTAQKQQGNSSNAKSRGGMMRVPGALQYC